MPSGDLYDPIPMKMEELFPPIPMKNTEWLYWYILILFKLENL